MRNWKSIAALAICIIALSACGEPDSSVVVELQPTTTPAAEDNSEVAEEEIGSAQEPETTVSSTTTTEALASPLSDGYAPTLDGAVSYLEDATRAISELDSRWLLEHQWSGCPATTEQEVASALIETISLVRMFFDVEFSALVEATELVVTDFNEEALTITVEARPSDDAPTEIRSLLLSGDAEVDTYAWEEGRWANTDLDECLGVDS